MKKTTLIAVAAVAATSAFASSPQKVNVEAQAQTLSSTSLTHQTMRVSQSNVKGLLSEQKSLVAKVSAQNEEEITTGELRYVPAASSFYGGMSPERRYYSIPLAFTGIRNSIGFLNISSPAETYSWTVGKVTGINAEQTDYSYEYTTTETTAESPNFFMALNPLERYTYPTLAAKFGTTESEYEAGNTNPDCLYHAGSSTIGWGWDFKQTGADKVTSYNEVLGVSPCTASPNPTVFPEFSIVRSSAEGYDAKYNEANGTPVNWYAYSSDEEKIENMVIKSFITVIPQMPSPYQLDALWFWFESETSSDVTLTINVYPVTENGRIDFQTVIGTGELNVAEGSSAPALSGGMPIVLLNGVDQDGYAIDAPVCVAEGQSVAVAVEGLDNEAILQFDMISNFNSYPADDSQIGRYLFPTHAYAEVNADVTINDTTENANYLLGAPYNYYTDETMTGLATPSDFCMYFSVNFPVVMNADTASEDYETAYFNVDLPVESEQVAVKVMSEYDIDQMIKDELITVSTIGLGDDDGKWIDYASYFDEETDLTVIDVWATTDCPADAETGRIGALVFTGYACDFLIIVTQPAGGKGSISEVATAVAGAAEYYDLQGRKLSAAPAKGLYIERNGSAASTKLAR